MYGLAWVIRIMVRVRIRVGVSVSVRVWVRVLFRFCRHSQHILTGKLGLGLE